MEFLWNFPDAPRQKEHNNPFVHFQNATAQKMIEWKSWTCIYLQSLQSIFHISKSVVSCDLKQLINNSKKAPSNNNNKRFSCSLGIYIVSIISFKRSISCVRKWIVSSIQARHVIVHSSVITTLKTTASDICDSLLL